MNRLQMLINLVNSGKNPQAIFQNMMSDNQKVTQVKNMMNGQSPKDFCIQLAKQQGISEEQLMQFANTLQGKR